jgi:DNA polymerase-1
MRTLLFDGDILAYQHAFKSEKVIPLAGGLHALVGCAATAGATMDEHIFRIIDALKADRSIVALSCPTGDNWRKKVLPTYKSNRLDTRKPVVLAAMEDKLREDFEVFERPTLEADDVLGILATTSSKKLVQGEVIICSIDKDFGTIPGLSFNWRKADYAAADTSIVHTSPEDADFAHLKQTLSGDAVDGYAGCPKVGPKTAEKYLTDPKFRKEGWNDWDVVVAAFEKAGLGEEEALRQARVARICRASDYDFKKKEVVLWTPTNYGGDE